MRALNHGWKVALLAVCLTAARPAQALESLDSFLERAKTHSFDAREAIATEEQRSAEQGSALGRLTPAFSARGVYSRNQEEVGVQLIDLANYHRYKAASKVAESAKEQRSATGIDVSRSVARAYYLLQGASALVTSSRESLKAAQANLTN